MLPLTPFLPEREMSVCAAQFRAAPCLLANSLHSELLSQSIIQNYKQTLDLKRNRNICLNTWLILINTSSKA